MMLTADSIFLSKSKVAGKRLLNNYIDLYRLYTSENKTIFSVLTVSGHFVLTDISYLDISYSNKTIRTQSPRQFVLKIGVVNSSKFIKKFF